MFNENLLSHSGGIMINVCSYNELRLNITFHDHKEQYKYSFQNTICQKSVSDCTVTNRNILYIDV